MIANFTTAQARVVNNCACYSTRRRLMDAGVFWGCMWGHADAANDNWPLEAWS